jgi:hypothetical protein
VSRWSDSASAKRFADTYAGYLPKRYNKAQETSPSSQTKRVWTTEEGPVFMVSDDDLVIITESLEPRLSDQLAKELFRLR